MTLVLLVVTAAAGAAMFRLPMWAPAVPVLAFLLYLRHVRSEARNLYERQRRARSIALLRAEARRRAEAVVAARVEREASSRRPEPVRPGTIHPDGTWEPMRLPLPTYVRAPVVHRAPARVVAVAGDGAWTSGQLSDLMSGFRGRPAANAVPAFSSRGRADPRPAGPGRVDRASSAQAGAEATRLRPAANE